MDISEIQKNFQDQLLFNSEHNNLKEDFDNIGNKLTNPYKSIKRWLKFEMLDCIALNEAVAYRDRLEKLRNSKIAKVQDLLKDERKLSEGGFTFGTIFKSREEKVGKANAIKVQVEALNEELTSLDKLVKLVTYFLSQSIIPFFKENKFS